MEMFSSFFGLKLAFVVFGTAEQASLSLQHKDINAQEVCVAINAASMAYIHKRGMLH